MSFAPIQELENLVGRFVEVDFGKIFEYKLNKTGMFTEFEYIMFVGGDQERFANIKKTVAYVLVDEYEVQKWNIKQHKVYERV